MNIGVLSLQGGVIEHLNKIKELGHNGVEVKSVKDLENIDKIILPGGESTTIGKLLKITGLIDPLKEKIKEGMPVWGTCAGMILLSKEIENDSRRHLELMNIKVQRNGFGTQINSFKINKIIKSVSEIPMDLVFIRAPYVVEAKSNVEVLCKALDKIVAVREKNMVATAFHPELTESNEFYKYFINMVE